MRQPFQWNEGFRTNTQRGMESSYPCDRRAVSIARLYPSLFGEAGEALLSAWIVQEQAQPIFGFLDPAQELNWRRRESAWSSG